MKEKALGRTAIATLALAALFLAACGTPPARDFGGSWHPVNRYQSTPTEIPLHREYIFFAAPIDETLKSMLGRWASDSDRTLNYQLSYDVTLYAPVARIQTNDLNAATAKLNSIYAAQGVRITTKPGEIVVKSNHTLPRPSAPAASDASESRAARP